MPWWSYTCKVWCICMVSHLQKLNNYFLHIDQFSMHKPQIWTIGLNKLGPPWLAWPQPVVFQVLSTIVLLVQSSCCCLLPFKWYMYVKSIGKEKPMQITLKFNRVLESHFKLHYGICYFDVILWITVGIHVQMCSSRPGPHLWNVPLCWSRANMHWSRFRVCGM